MKYTALEFFYDKSFVDYEIELYTNEFVSLSAVDYANGPIVSEMGYDAEGRIRRVHLIPIGGLSAGERMTIVKDYKKKFQNKVEKKAARYEINLRLRKIMGIPVIERKVFIV